MLTCLTHIDTALGMQCDDDAIKGTVVALVIINCAKCTGSNRMISQLSRPACKMISKLLSSWRQMLQYMQQIMATRIEGCKSHMQID